MLNEYTQKKKKKKKVPKHSGANCSLLSAGPKPPYLGQQKPVIARHCAAQFHKAAPGRPRRRRTGAPAPRGEVLPVSSKADGPVAVATAATGHGVGAGPRRTLKVGHRAQLRDRFRNDGVILMAANSAHFSWKAGDAEPFPGSGRQNQSYVVIGRSHGTCHAIR